MSPLLPILQTRFHIHVSLGEMQTMKAAHLSPRCNPAPNSLCWTFKQSFLKEWWILILSMRRVRLREVLTCPGSHCSGYCAPGQDSQFSKKTFLRSCSIIKSGNLLGPLIQDSVSWPLNILEQKPENIFWWGFRTFEGCKIGHFFVAPDLEGKCLPHCWKPFFCSEVCSTLVLKSRAEHLLATSQIQIL